MSDLYFFSLCGVLFASFGLGLCHTTKPARIFAYMGILAYIIGLFIGVYYAY